MDILCNNINCDGIGMRRADWDNFRECERIMLNGQVIWESLPLSQAVKSQIYEDIVTTGHHSASLAAEVWRAANAYCKAHKLAHPELTEQGKILSNFVNADPDLYCSLPLTATPEALSAMPKRSLIGHGVEYINLGEKARMDDTYEMEFRYNVGGRYRGWGAFGQQSYIPQNMSLTYSAGVSVRWAWNGQEQVDNLAPTSTVTWHTLKIQAGVVTFDGVNKGTSGGHKAGFVINYPMYLFTINPANTTPSATMNGRFRRYKHNRANGDAVQELLPCLNTATNKYGMLDIVNLQWYGNAAATGSFTIEKS